MRRGILVLLMALPTLAANAQSAESLGTLNSFDVVNNTGVNGHGFEIELEGISAADINHTEDSVRYGSPSILEDASGAYIRYESGTNDDGSWAAYTAVPARELTPADGHLFLDPALNLGGEHFGFGVSTAPTAARYYWLIDDGSGSLVRGPQVDIATPEFVYFESTGSAPAQVVSVIAAANAPASGFGEPTWVKVTRTSTLSNAPVALTSLVSDNPNDSSDANWTNGAAAEVETEWALLQAGGTNDELIGAAEDVPNGDEVITRRYDFFAYTGPVDSQTGEALATKVGADGVHGDGAAKINGVKTDLSTVEVVGEFIGAQMTGVDTRVGPTVTLTAAGGNFTNTLPIEITATFSDTVTGLLSSEIVVTGGTISNFSGSGTTYTFDLDGITAGSFATVKINSGAAIDGLSQPNSASNTLKVTYDIVDPSVVSILRQDANPTKLTTVRFKVAFSEPVTGVDVGDFEAVYVSGAITGFAITGITGSGANYAVSVNTGVNNGSIRLVLNDNDTITDLASNPLTGGFTTGQSYTVDKTRPSVTLVNNTPGAVGLDPIDVTATFSENVLGFELGDITAISGTISNFVPVSGSVYTFTLTPTTVGTTAKASIGAGKTADAAGNTNTASNVVSVLETVVPEILSITRQYPTPNNGTSVKYKVTFSEPVTGVSLNDFDLNPTLSGASVFSVSGSGANYSVTVKTGTGSGNLRLNLIDAASIADIAGNDIVDGLNGQVYLIDKDKPTVLLTSVPASPSGPALVPMTATFNEPVTGFVVGDVTLKNATISNFVPVSTTVYTFDVTPATDGVTATASISASRASDTAGNTNVASNVISIVETVAPTVTGITLTDDTPTNRTSVKFKITFSETVQNVSMNDFALDAVGPTGAAITAVSGSGANYSVTVATGTGDGTLEVSVIDGATINDIAGNPLADGFDTGEIYDVDKTKPSVTLISDPNDPTGSAPVDVLVQFSEEVTGFVQSDITLTNATVSGFQDLGGGDFFFVLNPGTPGINATAKIVGGKAADLALNTNTGSNTITSVEDVEPFVVGTDYYYDNPTNRSTVIFIVTFSEAVTGVDVADFALASNILVDEAIVGITGSGATYNVSVATGTGDGTLELTVLDNSTIVDTKGNPLTGPFDTGVIYTVDKTKPTVVLTPDPVSPVGNAPVDVLVEFSEPVTGFIASDITVTNATVSNFTGTGDTYGFTLNPTVDGTNSTAKVNASKAADLAANTNTASNTVLVVEDVSPTVTSIELASATPTKLTSVKFTVTFSEPVDGVDTTDFDIVVDSLVGASITAISGSDEEYDVTVSTGTGDGTVQLVFLDDSTVEDLNDNPLTGGDFLTGDTYTVDKTKPTVTLTPDPVDPVGTDPVDVLVEFSEEVTGFVVGDITVTNATVSNFAGTGDTYSFTLTPTTAGLSATAKVNAGKAADAAGNTNELSNTVTVLENVVPSVQSIALFSSSPSNLTTVRFVVTFSEDVTGVDLTDFSLVTSGVAAPAIASMSGSGDEYTVFVTTGTGDGTIQLILEDDGTIDDLAGNSLDNGFTTGDEYTIDKTRPSVVFSSDEPNPTGLEPFQVTITFDEPVTGLLVTEITVTNATASNLQGSGAVYTFDLDPIAVGESTAALTGGKAADAAANTNLASNTLSRTIE